MGMLEAVKSCFKQYVGFSGRARRSEYWFFGLFNVIVVFALMILSNVASIFGILYAIYYLAIILPSLACTVRRLHDIGKSGVWFLISFVPLVGGIILFIFCVKDGEAGDNQYGPNPKTTVNA